MKIPAVILVILMACLLASTSSMAGDGKETYLEHLEVSGGMAGQGKEAYLGQAVTVRAPKPDKGKKDGSPPKVVNSPEELFSQSFKAKKAAEAKERETALKKATRLGYDSGADPGDAKTGK